MDTFNHLYIRMARLGFAGLFVLTQLLYPNSIFSAEVEGVEDSGIPASLQEAIQLKKESEFKIIPIADITALGTYSRVAGSGDVWGAYVAGSVAPVIRIDRQNYIIPLYYGSYNKEYQIVVEEEGGRLYNELMDHNLTIEYKHIVDDNTVLKLDGLMRLHYVKEEGDSWSDGLYDYEDYGASTSVEYYFINEDKRKSSITLGGEYYNRSYPNYKSLISLASVTSPETDEKDYNGYRPTFNYRYTDEGLVLSLFYSPLYKDFEDKKVIDANGVLTDTPREDWFHYANARFSYVPKASPLAFGLSLTGIIVDSNQNYYDSLGTLTLTDDVATENYYSFRSIDINPSITYIYRMPEKKSPATLTLGYSYLLRDYADRKAQDTDGSYTPDTQLDKVQTLRLQGVYPITETLSAVAVASYSKGRSNMKYESYYQYGYESYFCGAGIRVKF